MTPPTLPVEPGDNPPPDTTQPPGASGVVVLQIQVTNPSSLPATLTSLTLSATGTGDDAAGIDGVELWLDADGDGTISSGDTLLGTAVYNSNDGTVNFILNMPMTGGGSLTLLVAVNFSVTAPDGSYQTSVDPGGIAAGNSAGAVEFSGLPVSGSFVNLSHDIITPTPTPSGNTEPVVYPNPSTGGPVNILPPLTKASDVKVQIFTVAFRRVNETAFPQVPAGASVSITLTDFGNKPLASGLYYVVVETDSGRSIAKLMIIR
jgi:hypothetical protein